LWTSRRRSCVICPNSPLTVPGAADKILVRHLISHTNGIDADLYFLDVNGPNALKSYVAGLARHCGTLFEPGEQVSCSNGGMIVAGRLLEVVTGMPSPICSSATSMRLSA
jgi:CubicO group peptidase (beta-lactamase class C family)